MLFEILPDQLDYETERGKPMPSKLHALLTQRLTIYLMANYHGLFEVLPELTLNTPGADKDLRAALANASQVLAAEKGKATDVAEYLADPLVLGFSPVARLWRPVPTGDVLSVLAAGESRRARSQRAVTLSARTTSKSASYE